MFENSGSKIKVLALICFWISLVGSVIAGLALIDSIGIIIILLGILSSWLSTIVLYGMGEGIENSEIILSEIEKERREINKLREDIETLLRRTSKKTTAVPEKPETGCNEELERPGKKLSLNLDDSDSSETHFWRCIKCGKKINTLPCPYCSDK